jgi:hypothetical protein
MDLNPISHYNPIIAPPPLIKILDPPLVGGVEALLDGMGAYTINNTTL